MSNGWFPRLNRHGDVASGSGEIFVNGNLVTPGWAPTWYLPNVLMFKGAGDCPYVCDLSNNNELQQVSSTPCVAVAAGGGAWMMTGPGRIHVSVSHEGFRTWVEEQGGSNYDRTIFIEEIVADVAVAIPIVEHQPVNYSRLEGGYTTWTFYGGPRGTEVWGRAPRGTPQLLQASRGGELAGVPVPTPFGPCVLIQTQADLRLVKWGTTIGRVLTTGVDRNLYPDALWHEPTGEIRVVCNDNAGNLSTFSVDYDALTDDVLEPPVIEPPPIDPPEPPMSVPYEFDVVQAVNAAYPHLLQQNTGASCGEFTERVVWELAKTDDKWGHVGKNPGQNQHNGHAIDAVMYRSDIPDNVVDIINSSGDGNPTTPSWQEKGAYGQPWTPPIPVDEEQPPVASTHMYIGGENDTGFCDDCGRSRFDSVHEIPESKIPHAWDPGENGEGLCDICQRDASDPIHTGEPPPEPPPSNVQDYLDHWLEGNPEAQEYITKLYHVPEGEIAPDDATYQVRLNPTANLTDHITVAAVTTAKGTAFCDFMLGLGD